MYSEAKFSSNSMFQLSSQEVFIARIYTDLGIAFDAYDPALIPILIQAGYLAGEASRHFSSEEITERYQRSGDALVNEFRQLLDDWEHLKPRIRPFSQQINKQENGFKEGVRSELDIYGFGKFVSRLKEATENFIVFIESFLNSQLVSEFLKASEKIKSVEEDLKINVDKSKMSWNKIDQLIRDIDAEKVKAEGLVKEIGLLPTKQQVENYASIFKKESDEFRESAEKWMKRLVTLIVIVIVIGIINIGIPLIFEIPEIPVSSLVQINLAKLIVLTCLFFGISLSAKNYKVAKHNEVLNRHRSNAISSFDAFVMSVGTDESIKNAILLEVTRTIFSNQQTGFINNEIDESPSKIIEIIKNVQSKS